MSALSTLVRDTDKLVGVYEAREAARQQLEMEVEQLQRKQALLTQTDLAITALLAQTSAENLKAIEDLVTSGLAAIFDDLALSFKFNVEQTRGQQSLEPVLLSGGLEGPILDSHGGGPASVVAVLLRILTVHRLKLAPFIVLDESLSMLSANYVGNAAKFLVGLCAKLGLRILMVTHQQEFVTEATRAYEIVSAGPQGATFKLVEGP
jgi:chromosome segregation ATPase